MKCAVDFSDSLTVRNEANPQQALHLDISPFYCKLFETTREQSKDYMEEVMQWVDEPIENYDYLVKNIMHCTAAQRRHYGFDN